MPVFGGVAAETLEFLVGSSRVCSRAEGDYFIREGEQPGAMYVLERGRVEVIKLWDGQAYRLRELGPGDSFGEMAMIDLFPRSASVRALEACGAVEIRHTELLELFNRNPEQFAIVQMNIAREISRRLRTLEDYLFRTNPEAPWPAELTDAPGPGAG